MEKKPPKDARALPPPKTRDALWDDDDDFDDVGMAFFFVASGTLVVRERRFEHE